MYTFEKTDKDRYMGGCLIMNVDCKEELYPAKVITLFGQPDYFTEDYEQLFSCVVAAKDENGRELVLEIYHGPSGPAIGGGDSPEEEAAAAELAELIKAAELSDYEWEGDYEDVPVHIRMGVKNGVPYNESDFPEGEDFDPEDFM
ncbi:MAG: hypothetical protein K6B74_14195 [Ruminococcus sp.]|nr:hypothetical protein [Ruminococcus sp.]